MKEQDIRPQKIFDEYLRLTDEDTKIYFADTPRTTVACPACGAAGTHVFDKSGFGYSECGYCLTLFVNPRPPRDAFEKYYQDSPSTRYWATTFYKETETARREKIWKPKAELIKAKVSSFSSIKEVVDIGGGYGTFAEEIRKITDWNILIIEPSLHLASVCRRKGFTVVEKFLENTKKVDLGNEQRCFVSFELFEHLHNPETFLNDLHELMGAGDLFIFSTLSSLGVDIQVLWEHSKAVAPPHHLNFFNPSSIRLLLTKCGLETLEVTTPGRIDLDIIENNLQYVQDRFWKTFFNAAKDDSKADFQTFLSTHLLSSHMMVICRKK